MLCQSNRRQVLCDFCLTFGVMSLANDPGYVRLKIIFAPISEHRMDIARPMPDDAPVTNIVLLDKENGFCSIIA